jgi:hypothetical protein
MLGDDCRPDAEHDADHCREDERGYGFLTGFFASAAASFFSAAGDS